MDDTTDTDRIALWIEEGQRILGVLPELLQQHDRGRSRTVQMEQETERLRHEIAELRRENHQLRTERDEIAEAFNKVMNDVVSPMNEIATRIKVTPRRINPFEREPRGQTPVFPTPSPTS
jgi:uncharacterized coiled-coil DUF342 family protein